MEKSLIRNCCISKKEVSLSNAMRSLWEQHVYWTRMLINSISFNSPDIDAVTSRLLQNAPEMGALLRPFYGEKVATKYSDLLESHLIIAAKLVTAAKDGNEYEFAILKEKWYKNGAEIAIFLSCINPFISRKEFQHMFFEHLDLTINEASLILSGSFEESIEVFNQIEAQALEMADTITNAIVKQFPECFGYKRFC